MADKEKNAGQEAAVKKANKAASADSKKSVYKQKKSNSRRPRQRDKEKKGFFSRIAGWFKDLKKEFKKVVWPDRKKVFNNTLVVVVVVVIGSVLVGLIDSGLLKLMQFLMGLSN